MYKVLGPTADYIGQELKGTTQNSINNVKRIFATAAHKLGDRIDQPGAVPPRVVKHILQEGRFCDDELMAEYFGGVLASSRTEITRDDRGAAILSLVSRLTTYQIRSHYIFYWLFKELFDGESLKPGLEPDCRKMRIFVPWTVYVESMDFSEQESFGVIVGHVLWGLLKEQLIGEEFATGTMEDVQKMWKEADKPGLVLRPAAFGIELFLWAHGKGDLGVNQYLNPKVQFQLNMQIPILSGSKRAPRN